MKAACCSTAKICMPSSRAEQNLAVVPQTEMLHDLLPLDAALRYTARLRLPSDMSRAEIENCVSVMLDSVRLSEHRGTRIRQLSGGQRKRAGWVNEAICNPSLIFLDEVTSGLDEQTDCEMMHLFRQMADDGKTVVCVTHRVGYVEETCHLAAILGPGGVLAFVGPPAEALAYFDVPRLGDVYQRLQDKSPAAWKEQFRQSSLYERYVEQRLPRDAPRKVLPASRSRNSRSQESLVAVRQLLLLVRRYLAIQLADKGMLAMMLGQSLLIAWLLIWVFGDISQPSVESEALRVADVAAPGVAWAELLPETQAEFRKEASQAANAALTAKILFCSASLACGSGATTRPRKSSKNAHLQPGTRCRFESGQLLRLEADRPRSRQYPANVPAVRGRSSVHPSGRRLAVAIRAPRAGFLDGRRDRTGHLGGRRQRRRGGDDGAHLLIPQIIMAGILAPLAGYTRGFAQIAISAYWGYQGLAGTLEPSLQDRLRDAGTIDLGTEWDLARVCSVLVVHILVFAIVSVITLRLPRQQGEHAAWPDSDNGGRGPPPRRSSSLLLDAWHRPADAAANAG